MTPQTYKDRVISPWASGGEFGRNWFVPIRLFLALVVIYSHSFALTGGEDDRNEPFLRLTDYDTFGGLAVDMFFAISGMLITRSWETSATTRSYLLKRILRIYPAFVAVMLIQAFAVVPFAVSGVFQGYTARQLGLIAFEICDLVGYGFPYGGGASFPYHALPEVFETNPIHGMNGSLWTIRYEFLCYLSLPVLAWIYRDTRKLALTFIVVLAIHSSGWKPTNHWFLTATIGGVNPWPRLLSFFLAGALFYRLRDSLPRSGIGAIAAILSLVIASFVQPSLLRFLLPTAGVYLLFWVAYSPLLLRVPMPSTGDFSYGVYLYAFPIQQLLIRNIDSLPPAQLTLMAGVLSLFAGAISWHAIEKRFLALKPKSKRVSPPEPLMQQLESK